MTTTLGPIRKYDEVPQKKKINQPYEGPEFIVPRDAFDRYFDRPLPPSTFHDLVDKGQIIPWPHMRGRFYLNASLQNLGLQPVSKLPGSETRDLEDIVHLAFTLIDRRLFPEPAWLLRVEAVEAKDADHAILLAEKYREKVEGYDHVHLKLAYFQGVLDRASTEDPEA